MSDRRSWRGYIPLRVTPQVGPAGAPNSPKIDMVGSTGRSKNYRSDYLWTRHSGNLSLRDAYARADV